MSGYMYDIHDFKHTVFMVYSMHHTERCKQDAHVYTQLTLIIRMYISMVDSRAI